MKSVQDRQGRNLLLHNPAFAYTTQPPGFAGNVGAGSGGSFFKDGKGFGDDGFSLNNGNQNAGGKSGQGGLFGGGGPDYGNQGVGPETPGTGVQFINNPNGQV